MKHPTPLVSPFQASFLRPLCLAAVLLLGAALPGWAADSSWDEEAGGDFDTGGNWTAGVPGAGDTATFALNETYTVEFGSATTTNLKARVENGTVTWDLDGNTYVLTAPGGGPLSDDALIVQGAQSPSLLITGGGILDSLAATGANNARIGFASSQSGSVMVDGATWNNAGRILLGASNATAALTVQNGGVVTSTGNVAIGVSDGVTVTVTGAGSSLEILGLDPLSGGNNTFLIEDGAQLLVSGNSTLRSGTTMTVTGSDTVWNGDTTSRTVNVSGGELTITDGATSNVGLGTMYGSFTVSGGAVFGRASTVTMTNSANSLLTITGAGTEFTAGNISLNGNNSSTDNEHRIIISDGALFTAGSFSGAAAGRTGSEILITGENTVANFTVGLTNFSLAIGAASTQFLTVSDGGTLNTRNFYVGWEGYAVVDIDGGTMTMSNETFIGRFAGSEGVLQVVNGGTFASPDLRVGREGDGTLTISGGSSVTTTSLSYVGQLAGSSGLVTVSGSNSTWEVGGTLSVGREGTGTLTVSNGGSVEIDGNVFVGELAGSSGSVTVDATSSFDVDGTLTVGGAGTGILTLEEGTFVTISGAMVIGENGTLEGDGFIFSHSVTNAGLVSPGNSTAILYLSGDYTQEATGTLEIGIGGTTPGSGHDQLSNFIFGTTATLEGTLTLLAVDEFMPSIGDSFLILDFVASGGSIVGEFDTINAFTLSGSRFWDFDNLYTTGTVSVIPEPATVAFLLGALALAGVLWRRRRLRNA